MKLPLGGSVTHHLKRLPSVLTNGDRLILAVASIILCIGFVGLVLTSRLKPHIDIPLRGGELVEGIVAASVAGVDKEVASLTTIGLLRYNEKGEITPALADSYTISDDGLSYTFKIHSGIDDASLVDILKDPLSGIGTDNISTSPDHFLTLKLNTPYSPLLGNLTKPLFPYGPYEVQKRTQKEIFLTSRHDFIFGEPLVSKIRYKIYPTINALERALQQGEVLAGSGVSTEIKGFSSHILTLQRKTGLLFNLDRDPWKQTDLRVKIARKETFASPLKMTLTTPQDTHFLNLAQSLQQTYKPLGVDIEIKSVDDMTMRENVVAKRDFDVLLYGIDTGRDPDPFPFWHSSQIGEDGANLSGFKNKEVDALLEQALLITQKEDRQKKYDLVTNIINEQVPVIYLDTMSIPYLLSNKVQGIKIGYGVTPGDRYVNVWEWYILTKRQPK